MIKTFVKRPVKVQAVQWTGANYEEIADFVGHINIPYTLDNGLIIIETLEGNHYARKGDWIIRGVNGEFYPCKPDIFKKTYEEVNMVFMTMSTWDNGSGCFYYTKEEFLKEISAMIDDCIANGATHFDAEITTDASCYLMDKIR